MTHEERKEMAACLKQAMQEKKQAWLLYKVSSQIIEKITKLIFAYYQTFEYIASIFSGLIKMPSALTS